MVSVYDTYEFKWLFIKKNFVDRDEFFKIFNGYIDDKNDEFLLNIYGLGGIGKSHIVNQIREIINQKNDKEHNIAFTHIDFLSNDISPITNFQTITRDLEKFGFEFHCFNFALHQYYTEKGNMRMAREIVEDHFLEYSEYYEFAGTILNEIVRGIGGPLKSLLKIGALVDLKVKKQIGYIQDFFSVYYEISTEEKIDYLGWAVFLDLVHINYDPEFTENFLKKKRKIVFLFDAFEKFHDRDFRNYLNTDRWLFTFIKYFTTLKTENSIINPLFIISGRDSINWDKKSSEMRSQINKLPQIGLLDRKYCLEYLDKCKIPEKYHEVIYTVSQGYPFPLCMLAIHYYQLTEDTNRGGKINDADFALSGDNYHDLYQRVINHLPQDISNILESLTFCMWFDRKLLEDISKLHNISWSEQSFFDITGYAFCKELPQEKFTLYHEFRKIAKLNILNNYTPEFIPQKHQKLYNILEKYYDDVKETNNPIRVAILRQLCYQGILSEKSPQKILPYIDTLISDFFDVYFISDLVQYSLNSNKISFEFAKEILKKYIQLFPLRKFDILIKYIEAHEKLDIIPELSSKYFTNNWIVQKEIIGKNCRGVEKFIPILVKYQELDRILELSNEDIKNIIKRSSLEQYQHLLFSLESRYNLPSLQKKVVDAFFEIDIHLLTDKFDNTIIKHILKIQEFFTLTDPDMVPKFRKKLQSELSNSERYEFAKYGISLNEN